MKALFCADKLGGEEEVGEGEELPQAHPPVSVPVSLRHQPTSLLTSPEYTLRVKELDHLPPKEIEISTVKENALHAKGGRDQDEGPDRPRKTPKLSISI
jgi:hypothetical protein